MRAQGSGWVRHVALGSPPVLCLPERPNANIPALYQNGSISERLYIGVADGMPIAAGIDMPALNMPPMQRLVHKRSHAHAYTTCLLATTRLAC